MSVPAKPSYLQSVVCTLLLISLLLATFPLSCALSASLYLYNVLLGNARIDGGHSKANSYTTVLVTGARTTKSLIAARIFFKAGYRVVMADERQWGAINPARFSRCVARYYDLPDPLADHEAYERAIRDIIGKEGVKLWVPGSSAAAEMNDARIGDALRAEEKGVVCFIQSAKENETLHNKDLFGELVKELGFDVPESQLVDDVDEAVDFLHSEDRKGRKYIVKCTDLDDKGRSDLTQVPMASREATRAHLSKLGMDKEQPYVLQQFILGKEWCTHCAAVDGGIRVFVCCASSDMLMRYVDSKAASSPEEGKKRGAPDDAAEIARKAEVWTKDFLKKWKRKLDEEGRPYYLTGHFSFDFIVGEDGVLFPIECNPRIHTAVVLFGNVPPSEIAKAYFKKPTDEHGIIRPPRSKAKTYSWIFHAIPIALIRGAPPFLQHFLHPLLGSGSSPGADPSNGEAGSPQILPVAASPPANISFNNMIREYISGEEIDPLLDPVDPWPFAAQHVVWIWLLARLVFWESRGWSRVNVSTSRLFSV